MEVSSHALQERRVAGIGYAAGTFTNLSQDHLDYHSTMKEYAAAKRLLFTEAAGEGFVSAINIGDPVGAAWNQERTATTSYGAPGADLTLQARSMKIDSLDLTAEYEGQVQKFTVRLGGRFNVWNVESALATLLALGYGLSESCEALGTAASVPGRFESIQNGRGIGVIVDYAHTDDALEKLLVSVRDLEPNRVITVFGCGGDRDRTKRPKMAKAASENSDITVVTSDNPRTEDPQEIIADVVEGLMPGKESYTVSDRREAVAKAIGIAQPGDVVVVAGKGHEDYQIIGREKLPMDDRDLIREALEVPS